MPANVQQKWTSSVGGTTNTLNFTSDVTVGNIIALAIHANSTPTVTLDTVVDNLGNSYVFAGDATSGGDGLGQMWNYYAVVTVGGACTITATFSASKSYGRIFAHEISGVDLTSPLDQHAGLYQSNAGTGTDAVTSTAQTTVYDGEYIFGCTEIVNSLTITAGTNFTELLDQTTGSSEYYIQPTAGSIAATFTESAGFARNNTVMMTFKPSGTPITGLGRKFMLRAQ